jgi:baculoviral IAP repeat-containing protein 6
VYPADYGTATCTASSGGFALESSARALRDWAKDVTKKLAKAAAPKPTKIGDILNIALATDRKPVKKAPAKEQQHEEEEEEEDEGDEDYEEMATDGDGDAGAMGMGAGMGMGESAGPGADDFDLEGKVFQDGLEVLKMKKRWAAKESELREKAKRDQQAAAAVSDSKSRVTQIFSSGAATGVLTNDLLLIRADSAKLGFSAEPVDDNIYDWSVKIFDFREGTQIQRDMQTIKAQYGYDYCELRIGFTMDLYPFYPPIVRVVRPRFQGFMMGRVTSMETLRLAGWDPVRDMRSVLQMIRELLEEHGKLEVNDPMNDIKVHPAGAYTELEFLLLRLELLCETPARVHAKYPELASMKSPSAGAAVKKPTAAAAVTTTASSTEASSRQKYWARGTGYGSGSTSSKTWDVNAYLAAQQQKDNETGQVLRGIAENLRKCGPTGVAFDVLEESCLVPVLESYLRNDSVLDMVQHAGLYMSLYDVCEALALQEEWLPLFENLPNQARSVLELLRTQNMQAKILLTTTSAAAATASEEQQIPIRLATKIVSTFNALEKNLERMTASIRELESTRPSVVTAAAIAPTAESPEQLYAKHMKPMQFDMGPMDLTTHHYASYKSSSATTAKTKIIRLAQEQASLAVSLPLARDSSVFVRICEDRVDFMRCLITGPSAMDLGATSTPYAGGCFQFDIHFPATYPNAPPMVNLMTTGHGTVRFNPNLYNCGKVCLSLLGTWSGAEGENWNSKTSTLLQVLVSIQSLILVPQPFFNEPGYEQQIGTTQGDRSSKQYNEIIRTGTVEHAIIGQLRSPSVGFEEVIRRHFYLQQDRIVAQCNKWADEAQQTSKAHYSRMLKLIRDMQAEFAKLSYPFPKLPV